MLHKKTKKIFFVVSLFVLIGTIPFDGLAQYDGRHWDKEGESDWGGQESEQIRGWRGYSSEVQQAINALASTPVQNLPIPILFGVEVSDLTSNFGDPRDGGARTHEGLDMLATKGTPVASPTEAVVIRTGEGDNSGLYVYTANPGNETFVYMHLDEIAEGINSGTALRRGQVIGYVGNTGNASGGPAHLHFEVRKDGIGIIDPFPRLTLVFSLAERVESVTQLLGHVSNPEVRATFLVDEYGKVFLDAMAQNISVPTEIVNALARVSSVAVITKPPTSFSLDLDIGSRGTAVVELQKFLIAENTGPMAVRLAQSGATGYFGLITQNALKEFQSAVGIKPAEGYYGSITRSYIVSEESTVATDTSAFFRDLGLNSVGEDVRALQKYLNEKGYLIAQTGAGSLGNETTYFGSLTRTALASFQADNGISPAEGYFGPITLKYIKSF